MALGDILVDLMFYETSFLLVVPVDPELTVGVGGVKGFEERGWTWEEKIFSRDIFE